MTSQDWTFQDWWDKAMAEIEGASFSISIEKLARQAFEAGRSVQRQRDKTIAIEQSYYHDTHSGKRQRWVKEQIAKKIEDATD